MTAASAAYLNHALELTAHSAGFLVIPGSSLWAAAHRDRWTARGAGGSASEKEEYYAASSASHHWARSGAIGGLALAFAAVAVLEAQAQEEPNILVIFGGDIGITNISAYSDGLMRAETPTIHRLAKEGIRFLDYYGEQSCTAGRQPSSPASTGFAPASPRWASRARPWA